MNALDSGTPALALRPRSSAVLIMTSLIGLVAFGWPFVTDPGSTFGASHSADAPWLFVLLIPLLVAVVVAELNAGELDAKAVALLGMLSAVGAALRAVGPGAVGLEPGFVLVILGGRVFGRGFGFVLGALTIFTGGLLTGGVGPWMPFQMLGAAWIGFLAGSLPGWRGRPELAMLAAYGVLAGLAYGWLLNLWFWPFAAYGPEVSYVPGDAVGANLTRYLTFWTTTSLGWDVPRGVLTALLVLLVGRPVLFALRRTAHRAVFTGPAEFDPAGGSRTGRLSSGQRAPRRVAWRR